MNIGAGISQPSSFRWGSNMGDGRILNHGSRVTLSTGNTGGGGGGATGPTGPGGATGPTGPLGPITLTGGATGSGTGLIPTGLARQPLPFTTLFIDPANVSGVASDLNTGATDNNVPPGSGPIRTTAHLNALVFQRVMINNTFVNYMSNDASGVELLLNTLEYADFVLTATGTFQQSAATTAVAVTDVNETTNQRETITFGIDPTPFILTALGGTGGTNPFYVKVVGGANDGTIAWIVKSAGVNQAFCSTPVNTGDSKGTISPGDTLVIGRGSDIEIGSDVATNLLSAVNFNIVDSGEGLADVYEFTNCSLPNGFSATASLTNCFVVGLFAFYVGIQFGVYVSTHDPTFNTYDSSVALSLSSGVYVTGFGILVNPSYGHTVVTFGDFANGRGAGFFDCTSTIGAIVVQAPMAAAGPGVRGNQALIWGLGNTGAGIVIGPGATLVVPAGSEVPIITGTGGDFAFVGQNGGALVTVARAWNDAAGAYTEVGGVATRTTTWAHLFTTISPGGGFDFQAHNPATNAAIVGL